MASSAGVPPTLDDATFPIRFTARQVWTSPQADLHAALRTALELDERCLATTISGVGMQPAKLDDAIAYDGFACLVGVRSKTFEGKKIALFDYAYYLRTGGTLVHWSSSLDPTQPAAMAKPACVQFKDGNEYVVITPELRARVKRLATRPPAA